MPNASLVNPTAVTFDTAGSLYIADETSNRIRKVDTNGIITTAAGSGNEGYSGDWGAATNASLYLPQDIAMDACGGLYMADSANHRIRKVYLAGYPALTLTGVTTNNAGNYTVVITSIYGSVTSAVATLTVLVPPLITVQPASQRALPGSNVTLIVTAIGDPPLYYSWYFNAINPVQSGTNASFIVTNLNTANAGPYSVVVTNARGSATSQVAILTAELPPTITRQPASQTVLVGSNVLFSVALDWTGPFTYQWRFNGTNFPTIISTVAGGGYGGDGGAATNANLNNPYGVTCNADGSLYIADSGHNCIRHVGANGIITTVAGNGNFGYFGDGGAATSASLYLPRSVALDATGDLYIVDEGDSRIRRVDTNGIITTAAGSWTQGYSGDGGAATSAEVYYPYGVAFDAVGNLYIADTGNSRIRRVDTNGIIATVAGNGSQGYSGDGGAATNSVLNYPKSVALNAAGDLYIADSDNNCIRKVDTNGIITTVAGTGFYPYNGDGGAATNANLLYPSGIALDAVGNLFIADFGDNRIRRVDTNGIITTVAGNGSAIYAGDGGAATNASANPSGVALYASGNLYIADNANNRIREVHFAGYPTFALTSVSTNNAGNYTVVITNPHGCVTSVVATLTVVLAPSILVQPASQGVSTGNNAILNVTATGTPPLFYLWYFNATNLLQAGTNTSLIVANINAANAGQYTVVVTNAYGSVTSEAATLAFPPSLITQPTNLAALPGTTARFRVTADGVGPFSYQWRLNGNDLPQDIISTVAGNGSFGFSGDGGAATNARLWFPWGVALDTAGNIYIADYNNNRIRKVDASGIITTVAGKANAAYSGDGGPATNAGLFYPHGVALDAAGNLYIADQNNNRIRKVATNGIISTVAGNGTAPYTGDGGAATNASLYNPIAATLDVAGNLFIADRSHQRIRKVDTNGTITTVAGNGSYGFSGDGASATNASLSGPCGVAFDALGNLYIADSGNNRVRVVDTNGIITTVAGNGSSSHSGDGGAATNASLGGPDGVAFDVFGDLYIADYNNNRIRKVDPRGIITTVAGSGIAGYSGDGATATNANLQHPAGVASDAFGNLYITDTGNNRIRKVLPPGSPTLTLGKVSAYNAGEYTAIITSPYGSVTSVVATLTVETPPIITAQPIGQSVLAGGNPVFSVIVAGSGPFEYLWYLASTNLVQSGTNSTLTLPGALAKDAGDYTVVITNAYGSVKSQVANLTVLSPPSVITQPSSQAVLAGANVSFRVTVDGTGPFTYEWQFNGTNSLNNIISTVAGNGSQFPPFAGDGGQATNAHLNRPVGVAFDAMGNLYIADSINFRIREVDERGIITTIAGNGSSTYSGDGGPATSAGLNGPYSVALDALGRLYIADTSHAVVRKVATNGIITTAAGNGSSGYSGDGGPATNASLNALCGMTLDAFGSLYIADFYNNRIRKVDTNGIITTVAGRTAWGYSGDGGAATNANLNGPFSVAFDALGRLYIGDYYNNRIRRVASNGIITTIAGSGSAGYSGDGGAATNAQLQNPCGVTLDAVGNLYLADTLNNRIRKVDTNGIITTVAGIGSPTYSGDGGTATNASLHGPTGVALDVFGNLYIADASNNRIRNVLPAGYPTLLLANVSASSAGKY